MTRDQKELFDLLDYIEGHVWYEIRHQVRAMWTTFCIHQDYEVDTYEYDGNLLTIWKAITKQNCLLDYQSFYNYMSELLV